jgi:hypothetical protein
MNRTGWGVSRRTMQIVLGVLWILDAALEAQPVLFGRALVTTVILPHVQNQPQPVAWSIRTAAHLVGHGVGSWNCAFATIQLAIGIGLLVPRLVRPALVVMFAWSLGVWWFGEGFGGLLTGTAMPLTGAPGAVVLYAVVGMLVWPTRSKRHTGGVGLASSGAAQGPLGASGALAAWSGLWILAAVLWLLPANRAGDAISSAIGGMAAGEPSWLGHFLNTVANGLSGHGELLAWLLALVSLVIGLGPVLTRRPVLFLAAGAVLQLGFWVTGMALGGILAGNATDPNIAPLSVLLAVGMVPTLAAVGVTESPLRALRRHHPSAVMAGLVTAGTVIVVAVFYPLVAEATPSSSALAIPTLTAPPSPSAPVVTTPEGGVAAVQFNAPTSFSCLSQYPTQAQVTIGWNVPSATGVTESFDGTTMHSGIRSVLPFVVPAGPAVGPGATLVFGCHSGVNHTIVVTWSRQGLPSTSRVVKVHTKAAP